MNCSEARSTALEHLHGAHPDSPAFKAHLADCPSCAKWCAQQTALDRQLTAALSEECLPLSWRANLRRQLAGLPDPCAPVVTQARRRALEEEYRVQLAHLHGRLAPRAWGLFLAYGAAIAVGAYAVKFILSSPLRSNPGFESAVLSLLAGGLALLAWYGAREARRYAG